MDINLDRVVGALAHLNRHAEGGEETGRARRQARPCLVAVAREAGAKGSSVGKAVANRLGWPVYDQELLQHIAQEKGLQTHLLEALDEQYVDWLTGTMRRLCAVPTGDAHSYLKPLLQLFATLTSKGHCVIVGRGAAAVLPAETTLNVRLVAPRAQRIATIQELRGLSAAEAERWVDRTDRERVRFVKEYFHRDPTDPVNYDLVLNAGRLSVDDCARLIVEALHAKEAHLQPALA
jgi:cytidylate kinase